MLLLRVVNRYQMDHAWKDSIMVYLRHKSLKKERDNLADKFTILVNTSILIEINGKLAHVSDFEY